MAPPVALLGSVVNADMAVVLSTVLPVATLKVEPSWQSPGAASQIASTDGSHTLFTPWAHVDVGEKCKGVGRKQQDWNDADYITFFPSLFFSLPFLPLSPFTSPTQG